MGRPAITLAVNTFFYDPFCSTTINLPPFHAPWYILDADRFTLRFDFSAPPTSAECMVVATIYDQWLGRLFTATLRRGQAAWRTAVHCDLKFCALLPHCLMVHHEGNFYCVKGRELVGEVLAFCPETNTIKGFSGDPRQAQAAKSASKLEDILCRRLEPSAALDLVERFGGEEL